MTTRAPSASIRRAYARPSPAAPPVTSATLPASRMLATLPTVRAAERAARAIIRDRGARRDVAVDDVVAEIRAVARGGIAEAAGARRTQPDLGTRRRRERALAQELTLAAVDRRQRDTARRAGAAARQPERRRLG